MESANEATGAATAVTVSAAGAAFTWISEMLKHNQFASGGLALMVTGLAAHALRGTAEKLFEAAKRKMCVRAEIDSRDDAYRWIMHWLSQHPQFKKSAHVSVTTSLMSFGTSGLEGALAANKKVLLLPAPGDHVVRYHGHWLWISRRRSSGNPQLAANARLLVETLTVTALGRNRGILEQLVLDAAASYESTTKQRTVVHSVDQDGYWTQVGSRPIRPLDSVVLPEGQAEEIVADCREFLASEEWYAHHGIPYRRGYLLYGAPGTGKTSLVTAIAGELQLDVYVVTLSSPLMTDEMLRNLLNSAADRCILLLEDVDAAFVGREAAETGRCSRITFSGLLNAIDGVAAQEGRLLFMTTNHIDRLSNALIRPGRVDVRCEFKLANRQQMRQIFVSFYHDLPAAYLQPANKPQHAQAVVDSEHEDSGGMYTSLPESTPAAECTAYSAMPNGQPTAHGDMHTTAQMAFPVSQETHILKLGATSTWSATSQQISQGTAAAKATTAETARPKPGTVVHATTVQNLNGHSNQANTTQLGRKKGKKKKRKSSQSGTQLNQLEVNSPDASQTDAGNVETAAAVSRSELQSLAEQFSQAVPEHSVSMAALQGHLMKFKRDPRGAAAAAHTLAPHTRT